jgi:cell division protein FtsQ
MKVKKILRNIMFLLSIPLWVGAFVFAQKSSYNETYRGAKVFVRNPEYSFVFASEILQGLEDQGLVAEETLVHEINVHKIEEKLESNPWIDDAEIFLTAQHLLHIQIDQKEPILRVQPTDTSFQPYYLDQQANPIPLSEKFVANVPIVTSTPLFYTKHHLNFKTQLVQLCRHITSDTFWNASVAQLDADEDQNLRMILNIGNQTIRLGTPENYVDKLNRLKTFYQRGIKTIDWDLYDEIDARYQGQIVCRNTKGLILAEDPYETPAEAQERVRVKTTIEREEQRIQKEKELQEKRKAKEKEDKRKREEKEKELQRKVAAKAETQRLKEEAKKAKLQSQTHKTKNH